MLLTKITYRLKLTLFFCLAKTGLLIGSPKLVAFALWMMSGRVNATGEYTVLCLGRSVFLNDVAALAAFGGRLKYVVVYKEFFRFIFEHFSDKAELAQLSEYNYFTENFCAEGKKKYNLYLLRLLPALRKYVKFDAVMSGNFGYPEQQEIEDACAKSGIPFIVLHKEGLMVPGSEHTWSEIYTPYKFRGTNALFYNEKARRLFLDCHFPGLSEKNVRVVGMPRLDPYFSLAEEQDKDARKQVLFFSPYPDDKSLGLINDSERTKEMKRRIDGLHKLVMDFAVRHKDMRVVIKTRLAGYYAEYVNRILRDNFAKPINNLSVISVGNPFDLIRDSIAVISYNSTTCIKAIAAGRVLISPYFGDLLTDRPWDYFGKHPEFVNYVKAESDIEEYITNRNQYLQYSVDRKKKFLEEMVGNSDGHSCVRAEEAIIGAIKLYA